MSALAVSTVGTCGGSSDEDGVTFDTAIIACGSADVTVTASQAGILDAWLDFDGNGTFEAADQIFTGQALVAGANALTFAVPCDRPSDADSYARFRLSTAGGLSFDGQAMDGEVEDYVVVTNGLDFGDAPETYGTTDPTAGASHVVDPGSPLFLGACVDTEAAGQPVAAGASATGDDLGTGLSDLGGCAGPDDEDGVVFNSMIVACGTANVTVTASLMGQLDGWIDFDGDGAFGASEQVFASQLVTPGANALELDVPCDTPTQTVTYARFRLSSSGGLGPVGQAINGEVEDYDVATKGLDLGDAPDTYATTVGAGGARHAVDPSTPLFLGGCVDTEVDGQPVAPGAPADGDDNGAGLSDLGGCTGTDDEDGVTFGTMIVACGDADITVTASQTGLLDAWIDFDGDGAFGGSASRSLSTMPATWPCRTSRWTRRWRRPSPTPRVTACRCCKARTSPSTPRSMVMAMSSSSRAPTAWRSATWASSSCKSSCVRVRTQGRTSARAPRAVTVRAERRSTMTRRTVTTAIRMPTVIQPTTTTRPSSSCRWCQPTFPPWVSGP